MLKSAIAVARFEVELAITEACFWLITVWTKEGRESFTRNRKEMKQAFRKLFHARQTLIRN